MGNWNRNTHYLCRGGCGHLGKNRRILKEDAVMKDSGRAYCPFCKGRLSVGAKSKTVEEINGYARI